MKKIFLIFLSINFLFSLNINQPDKQKHLIASSIISFTAGTIYSHYNPKSSKTKKFLISFGIATGIGILKEISDGMKKNNKFDHKDLQADILGALLGSIASIEIKW